MEVSSSLPAGSPLPEGDPVTNVSMQSTRAVPVGLTPDYLVYGLESASDPQIAPDGHALIYTRGKAKPSKKLAGSQIWRCNLDGSDARQLTRTGERNGGGRWSLDSRSIAFVSSRVPKSGIFVL